jgi:hypothetical protein
MRDAVRVTRTAVGPQDVAVAVLDSNGWRYYSDHHDDKMLNGKGIGRVPTERTLLVDSFHSPEIEAFVARHPDAAHVLVYDFYGISGPGLAQQAASMAQRNLCPTRNWTFPKTGIVVEYTRVSQSNGCHPPS